MLSSFYWRAVVSSLDFPHGSRGEPSRKREDRPVVPEPEGERVQLTGGRAAGHLRLGQTPAFSVDEAERVLRRRLGRSCVVRTS